MATIRIETDQPELAERLRAAVTAKATPRSSIPARGWPAAEGQHVQHVRTEWDGAGLPPVGTVCEALWSTGSGAATYATVKVLAHDEDRAVYRFLTLDRKGEYGSDTLHSIQGFAAFRPIRTAEQIAADERRAAIDEMVRRFALHDLDLVPWRDLFAQMYDAGCLRP